MKKNVITAFQVILLTLIYLILVSLVSGALITMGFDFPEMMAEQSFSFVQLIIAGFISSLLAVFLAGKYRNLTFMSFFLIIFFIFFLSNFSVAIEGNIFTPGLITNSVLLTLGIHQFSLQQLQPCLTKRNYLLWKNHLKILIHKNFLLYSNYCWVQ